MLDRPMAVDYPIERARFMLDCPCSCSHCKVDRDALPLIAIGNPFLADRLILVSLCPSCGAWSVLKGDVTLREPIQWEAHEISKDPRCTKLYVEFKLSRYPDPPPPPDPGDLV